MILLTLCELGVEPIVWVGRYAQVAGAQFPRRVLDPQLHWKISMGTVPINMLMAGRTEHTHRSRERREIFDMEEEKSSLKSLDTQNFFFLSNQSLLTLSGKSCKDVSLFAPLFGHFANIVNFSQHFPKPIYPKNSIKYVKVGDKIDQQTWKNLLNQKPLTRTYT